MNILVVLRMMPDPSGELELAEDGMALDREWLDLKLNDFDDHALEEAVLLKEAYGASVTAAAVGEGANRVLHMALARGADRAILVDCDPGAMISSRALAKTVAELAKQNGIDLILTGVQTPEDVFGQLAPYVGALLDWPHVSSTSGVAFAERRGAGLAGARRRRDGALFGPIAGRPRCPDREQGAALRVRQQASRSRQGGDRQGLAKRRPAAGGEPHHGASAAEERQKRREARQQSGRGGDHAADALRRTRADQESRAMKILICAETIGGAIDPLALELLSAARAIAGPGDEVVALVAGDGAMAGATLGGADRVVAIPHPTAETMTAEVYGRILRQVVEQESPDAILIGYTALGLDVAPHLAGRTGYPLVSYVTALGRSGDTVTAVSQIYGGKLVAESESPLPAIFMINPGRFRRNAGRGACRRSHHDACPRCLSTG